ncbi:hypothetical protein N007_05665 [Alicyclobacillus acidoterrestris ATCC 49025]|nr:hypothetical protein N007_05665 [Alicyclobacillus acidoterrestris ATCC 49025]
MQMLRDFAFIQFQILFSNADIWVLLAVIHPVVIVLEVPANDLSDLAFTSSEHAIKVRRSFLDDIIAHVELFAFKKFSNLFTLPYKSTILVDSIHRYVIFTF